VTGKAEERFYKRDEWPHGEWDDEPDEGSWVDEKTGFQCAFVRNGFGALCGYVGVPSSHVLFGKTFDEMDPSPVLYVHGGLTYVSDGSGATFYAVIPDLPKDLWWFGFDCYHAGDSSPSVHPINPGSYTYRNLAYVKSEITSLAAQLADYDPPRAADLKEEFVERRIAAWEAKHGLVTDEGRECLKALLRGCLNVTPDEAETMLAKPCPPGHENCHRLCFCERKNC